jgi:beta-galactosidase/beta-glucuronidase
MNFTAGVGWLRGVGVPNPKVWSPGAPNLHIVEVTVGGGAVLERFGLRKFGVDAATARLTVTLTLTLTYP